MKPCMASLSFPQQEMEAGECYSYAPSVSLSGTAWLHAGMPLGHLLQCAGSTQCHGKEHVMSTCLAHEDPLVPMQVFCMHSEPNYSLPWQRKRQFSSTSSGFVISGRRILTNAHSVDHHTQARLFTHHDSCSASSLGCWFHQAFVCSFLLTILLSGWFSCHILCL